MPLPVAAASPQQPAPPLLAPEQGQLVRLRNRLFLVQDAIPHESLRGEILTRLDLECLDDDRLGETLSVLWEREVHPEILQADAFPVPRGEWDHPSMFHAFLQAIRWSSASALRGSGLVSPFRGAIDLEPYQLEPAARAVLMPRVNLLIADDVGLGKTIEAALVVQELLARGRIRNCLIVCPASLQLQWRDELAEKFDLEFRVLDRDAMLQLRREYGTHVNPWRSYPRLITSLDFLKREAVLSQFEASVDGGRGGAGVVGSWDLLILDEAHNCAPAGRQKYVRDSDRTLALRRIAPHFQHRLFLTATPHNGFTESFTALLAELDPLRFHRGPDVQSDQVNAIMVRRLKQQLTAAEDVKRPFPERRVVALEVDDTPEERRLAELLDAYIASRMAHVTPSERFAVRFALNLLKKRFLSSPRAFARSIETHLDHLTRPGRAPTDGAADARLVERLVQQAREEVDDDAQRDDREQEALRESSRLFASLTPEEDHLLAELAARATGGANGIDRKLATLRDWIDEHLLDASGASNGERLILFTEYRDTLDYLSAHLCTWLGNDRILELVGGAPLGEREAIKAAFQEPPARHPVSVLLATDAAAEGLNLQRHCRYLVHYEIPWNPNRLEQRNGRIDRHGQPAPEVFVHHFLHRNRRDGEFLRTVVEKVRQQREDLGAVAAVLEASVEEFMLGRDVSVAAVAPRRALRDDVSQEVWDRQRLRQLRDLIDATRRDHGLTPEALREVLDAGLRLEGHAGLEPVAGPLAKDGARLASVPAAWGARAAAALRDPEGRLLTLVFDPEAARDRRDVALVHLDHPLMKRAVAAFRRHLFAFGLTDDQRLRRVTYRAAPPGVVPRPVLLAHLRLLAVGPLGQKLHEEVRTIGWTVTPGELVPEDPGDLHALVASLPASHPAIPATLGQALTRLVERSEPTLRGALRELETNERARVAAELDRRAAREAAEVEAMIDERRKEIAARLKQIEKDLRGRDAEQMRLALGPGWDPLEVDQLRQDIGLLERRHESLAQERKDEPARIRARWVLRSLRAFPVGVEIVLPTSVVTAGKLP